jgi:dipeptidyl aminopeptidase/acylaminoacyl peptidase
MKKFEKRECFALENNDQKIFGIAHRPLNADKTPAVLICHGLAGTKVGTHRIYVMLATELVKRGISAYRIDFRGSGDSEGLFGDMTFSDEVSDAVMTLNRMSEDPQIDPTRIGIVGSSFGGAIAISAAAAFAKIKSIALWASIFDVSQWEKTWEIVSTGQVDEEKRHDLMRINGQLPGMQFYEELFTLDLTKDHDALQNTPMLHIHGETDPVVSISHAYKFEALRKNATALTEFMRLSYSDHDFSHPEEKLRTIDKTCEWFKKTL